MIRRMFLTTALLMFAAATPAQDVKPHRAPAVPLVTHTPYFSVWAASDRPTDGWSRHWTGAINAMCGLVRVDDSPYRVLGPEPKAVPALEMTGLEILPTRTVYTFGGGGVELKLTFTSPLLPHDPDLMSRPVTYLSWEARSTDGKPHSVSSYFDATAEWAVNKPDQVVTADRLPVDGLHVLRVGTVEQPVLKRRGDDVRIDWGHFLIATPSGEGTKAAIGTDRSSREGFVAGKTAEAGDAPDFPRPANKDWPVLALRHDFGKVEKDPATWQVLIAYDEVSALQYFGKNLRPYWRKSLEDVPALLRTADRERGQILERCREFDEKLMTDLRRVGGKDYAHLCALSFRQCISAHGMAEGPDGKLVMLSKENFSNGCIGTVDLTYPSSPFFLLFDPELLKAQVTPVLDYGRSDRWKFPFAPHDLGTYPQANGQVYGGGEKTEKDQMPVEESGNMLILVAAITKAEGDASYAKEYWPLLTKWAEYLRDRGLDPENQLCTDDFAGHLAHNTNLSLKAIVALGGYAQLCKTLGKDEDAKAYREIARVMAARWVQMADDGDHYRLAFDKPGTWSQKYNLVWDKLLGLDLFPPEVARKEVAFYLKMQQEYGLPLDNRSLYTKLDWIVWTATLAESRADFEALISPLIRFVQKSASRVPLTDWYWTQDAKQQGFQARSVVGGVFIKMLEDRKTWKSWQPSDVSRKKAG